MHYPIYGNEEQIVTEIDTIIEEMKEDAQISSLIRQEEVKKKEKLVNIYAKEYEKELFAKAHLFKGRTIDYWAKNNPMKKTLRGKAKIKRGRR